jgi:predicted glycosyltransferase involved in capsule biosynthesis
LVLVNYNSSDNLDQYITENFKGSKILKYFKTTTPKYFKMSHAKNLSHSHATGDILVNLDADVFLHKNFVNYIYNVFMFFGNNIIIFNRNNPESNLIKPGIDNNCPKDLYGCISISKELFYNTCGYNEEMNEYGWEDDEFIFRCLEMHDSKHFPFNYSQLKYIKHSHDVRVENYENKNIEQNIINFNYFNNNRGKIKIANNGKTFDKCEEIKL